MNGRLFAITAVFLIMYIVQGIPFGLQEKYIPIHYQHLGLHYSQFSLFQLVHLPLISRILMAPFVDRIKQKHICVANCLFLTGSCYFFISVLNIEEYSTIRMTLMISNVFIALQDVTLDVMIISNLKMLELVHGNFAQLVGYKIGMLIGSGTFGVLVKSWNLPFIFASMSILQLGTAMLVLIFFNIHSQINECPSATSLPALPASDSEQQWVPRLLRNPHATRSSPVSAENAIPKENVRVRHAALSAIPRENCRYLPLSDAYCDIRDIRSNKDNSHSELSFSVTEMLLSQNSIWTILYVFIYKLGELGVLIYFPLFLIDAGITHAIVHWWDGIVCQVASILGCIVCSLILANKLDIYNNLWRLSLMRIALIFALLVLVLRTNEPIKEDRDKWLFSISISLLTALSFISGALKTVVFILMKVVCKRIPVNKQAFHYNFIAVSELLGKLTMSIFWGPAIDLFGEDMAFTAYFLLDLASALFLMRFPTTLMNLDESDGDYGIRMIE